ncbi:cytochrome c [Candidatus Methylospira mobilis]|uniref:Cytochrome c n=1 Tax=Candidatus Methylospira mobilis TaxID=1808979 RepID=A0A5Q0BJ50_9GAMM|nr:cytochrome c family protein [Candidatus Methylospira mobilis]QFY43589.1 cytochrome c [Candidatus Methylospira mobilis]
MPVNFFKKDVRRSADNVRLWAAVRAWLSIILPAAATLSSVAASAIELPEPGQLESLSDVARQSIGVIEPHESTEAQPVIVNYVGLPLDVLLTRWFGESWKAPDTEVVFFARDGYRSSITGERLQRFRAYLAFARADGAAFEIDNPAQNQKGVALGPYYLVWDNRAAPELLRQGGNGWPYQVTRIKLRKAADDQVLLPNNADARLMLGYAATREYCLTCHRIHGLGGEKYKEDLVRAACRWSDADLQAWIGNPGRIRPGTTMPPLALSVAQRNDVIVNIVHYLDAMKSADATACPR